MSLPYGTIEVGLLFGDGVFGLPDLVGTRGIAVALVESGKLALQARAGRARRRLSRRLLNGGLLNWGLLTGWLWRGRRLAYRCRWNGLPGHLLRSGHSRQ
jgi:hypothetical protein